MTFNGHYAVPPTGFYTQPPSVPPFNTPSFQYGIPPPIPPAANIQRFEANTQVPNPPIPYWNPEILKQLSQLPVPPPPPPPILPTIGTPPFVRPLSNAPQFQFQNTNNNRIGDLHEKAKEAIAALNPHVQYQDFLDEGISPSVLDKLYAELGIERKQPATKSFLKDNIEPVARNASEPVTEVPHDHVAEPIADAGLERKDRIARLLAAKKGRINTGTNSPAQASTPEVSSVVPEPINTAITEYVPNSLPIIPAVVEDAKSLAGEETSIPLVPTTSSPMSTRDPIPSMSTSSHAFSIPGLFMTADDHNESGTVQTRPKVNTDKLNARMAALKADMLRKKALQDGMPVLNAEVEKTRDRLTEQRNKLAAIREDILSKETQLSQAREEEARLLEEIERLENQLVEGENGQKKFNRELTQLNDQITEQQKQTVSQGSVTSVAEPFPPQQSPNELILIAAPVGNNTEAVENENGEEVSSEQSSESVTGINAYAPQRDVVMDEASLTPSENVEFEPSFETQSTHLTTTTTPSNGASMYENENDDDGDEQMSIDGVSEGESAGSASMSDSGSEYEPAIDQFETQTRSVEEEEEEDDDDDDNDEYDPQQSKPVLDPLQMEVENDDYEPSERLDPLNVEKVHEENPDGGNLDGDLLMQDNSHPGEKQATTQSPIGPGPPEEVPVTSNFPTRHSSVDRVAIEAIVDDEVRTKQKNFTVSKSTYEEIPPLDHKPDSNRSFTPYKSPLSMLKSFRFHPQFTELVPNGYRSLTYSNQVDVNRPLCATELEGKICTDTACEDQHFGGMSLSDDRILVQMSSAFDIKDKSQRDAYLIGLKKVIADLRERGVKEFSEVAGALSKYRRGWQAIQDGIVV